MNLISKKKAQEGATRFCQSYIDIQCCNESSMCTISKSTLCCAYCPIYGDNKCEAMICSSFIKEK